MSVNDTEKPAARYTLRPTFTPLPHATKRPDAEKDSQAARDAVQAPASSPDDAKDTTRTDPAGEPNPSHRTTNSAIRAANEDDDLYDPYSDYHDGTLRTLEFERDPWR